MKPVITLAFLLASGFSLYSSELNKFEISSVATSYLVAVGPCNPEVSVCQ